MTSLGRSFVQPRALGEVAGGSVSDATGDAEVEQGARVGVRRRSLEPRVGFLPLALIGWVRTQQSSEAILGLGVLSLGADAVPSFRGPAAFRQIRITGEEMAKSSGRLRVASLGRFLEQPFGSAAIVRNAISVEMKQRERDLRLPVAGGDRLLQPGAGRLHVSLAMFAADQRSSERCLTRRHAALGRRGEPFDGKRRILLDALTARVKTGDIMRSDRITLFRRSQEPARRFFQVHGDSGARRAQAPNNELRASISQFGRAPIPNVGLAEVRLDIRAAAIQFRQGEYRREIVLLRGAAQIGLGADEIARQSLPCEPHERCAMQSLRVISLRGLFEIGACRLLIHGAPFAAHEEASDCKRGARMALLGGALVPIGCGGRIRGDAQAAIVNVCETELRGSDSSFSRNRQALPRRYEIARPRASVEVHRTDDAIGFVKPVAGGSFEPFQSVFPIWLDLKPFGKEGLRVSASKVGIPSGGRVTPFRDAAAERSIEEDEPKTVLRPFVLAFRRALVPLDRFSKIPLDPLAFNVEFRDQKRSVERARRPRAAPSLQRRAKAAAPVSRSTTTHMPRRKRAPQQRSRRQTGGQNGRAHGSLIASPAPWMSPPMR